MLPAGTLHFLKVKKSLSLKKIVPKLNSHYLSQYSGVFYFNCRFPILMSEYKLIMIFLLYFLFFLWSEIDYEQKSIHVNFHKN